MVVLLIILTLLWIISIFSFAKLRIALSGRKAETIRPHDDVVCLAYLRISGVFILFVIISLVNGL